MRVRRLLPAALLIAGLACVLAAVLIGTSRDTDPSTTASTQKDGASGDLREPSLGGGVDVPVSGVRTSGPKRDEDSDGSRRPGRRAASQRPRSGLDVRIVAPVGHERPEVLRLAVVEGGHWTHAAEVRPDEDGRARIDLPRRRTEDSAALILDAAGFAWVTLREVRLGVDEVRYHGDVLLDTGRTISGRVVDDEGRGVGGATVTAYPPGVPPSRIGFVCPEPVACRTDDAGVFEIRHVPRGSAVLRVEHGMHVARPETVPDPTGPVRLVARRAGHIWGTIGREGGGGVGVPLRAEPLEPTWAGPLVDGSDSYGRIRMGPLLPGRYRVVMVMGERPGEPAGPDTPALPPEPIPDVELGVVTVEAGKYANVRWTLP